MNYLKKKKIFPIGNLFDFLFKKNVIRYFFDEYLGFISKLLYSTTNIIRLIVRL